MEVISLISIQSILIAFIFLITILLIIIFFNRNKATDTVNKTTYSLGTIINLNALGKNAEKAIDEAISKLNQIDDKMSIYKDYSEISKINSNAGLSFQKVSKETFFLIQNALEYSTLSDGAFDITIRPLVNLWGIGTKNQKIPTQNQIDEKLNFVNYNDVILNIDDYSVKLRYKKQSIDLGGIAKGYAADEIKKTYKKYKIKNGIIDLGGNIYAYREKADASAWRVGIQNPFNTRGEYLGIVNVKDKSVVTSGYYEKFFEKDNKKYHHIIDPRTGYPSESEIISSTIISERSLDGDGLSTGVYILGIQKATNLIESLKGVEAIFVTADKKVYLTSGIKGYFILTNEEFTLNENTYSKGDEKNAK